VRSIIRRSVRRGFTLHELICVIVLLAILAAASVPAIGGLESRRQRMAANAAAETLAFARQVAVATGTRTWIVFDLDDDRVRVYREDGTNPGRDGRALLVDPAEQVPFEQDLAAGAYRGGGLDTVEIEGDSLEIGFDYLGRPLLEDETRMTTDAVITLTGGHIVVVKAHTGHVM
jgi:prepilin-type N-terminal cleavage/methylation domain-containing protein